MQLLSESMPKWVTEDETVDDMIVDIMIDELHKLAEVRDGSHDKVQTGDGIMSY